MKNYLLSHLIIIILLAVACSSNDETSTSQKNNISTYKVKTAEFDLSSIEIPAIITAPAGAKLKIGVGNGTVDGIRTINYELVKDTFILDINYVVGAKYDKVDLLTDARQFAMEDEEFAEFVLEEEMGFIYKLNSEEGEDYNFYYLLLKDEQPIEFCTGLNYSRFTLEQVKMIYEFAKTAR